LQHVACWTKSFDEDMERVLKLGYEVAQSGTIGGPNGRFVYLLTGGHPGTIVELSEVSGAKGRFFEHIAEVAQTWDGSQPIRRM